jgi:Tol biopolymer transport system component
VSENKCPKLEFINEFPETEYSQSGISWSPDGRYALINNSYNGSLLLLDPIKSSIKTFATDLFLTVDRIIWSPDSKWAAVITQGNDEYSSKIVLLNPENGEKHELTGNIDGTIMPLGWQNGDNLLLYVYKYGLPGNDPLEKKVVIDANINILNIHNYQVANIPSRGISWKLISDVPELSPDRSLLAFSLQDLNSPLYLIDMDGVIKKTIDSFGNNPTWSPDGKWIAGVFPKLSGKELTACEIHIVNLENTGVLKILQLNLCPSRSITWLADSNHLLTIFSSDDDIENKAMTPLQIISINDGNIFIPEIDFNSNNILNISVRPGID